MNDAFAFPDAPAAKPLWLITLADLALLLVGFFVLVQATSLDRAALAKGLRAGFGANTNIAPEPPMPVAAGALGGFAPGSAALVEPVDALGAWARDAASDPRVKLNIAGSTDGSAADTDPATGSAALLAADRARAVAAALVQAGAVAPDRIILTTSERPTGRRVIVTLSFTGEQK